MDLIRRAQSLLDFPMGYEKAARIDGKRCVFVLEPHYRAPGTHGGPTGW